MVGVGTVAETGESVVPPIASHPQRDRREAEEKGQDRQEVEESSAKDCEDTMSHEMEIVNKGVEQSRAGQMVPTPAHSDLRFVQATMEDLAFIDALQKMHTKMVGWMPTKQLEGKIWRGHVIVAETVRRGTPPHPSPSTSRSPRTMSEGEGQERSASDTALVTINISNATTWGSFIR